MIKKFFKYLIGFYKLFVSPALPPVCRFYPTCSDYTSKAIEAHGGARGMILAAKRLLRCHPLTPGGYDPVPPTPQPPNPHGLEQSWTGRD
jgi:putative membrane protein insertion efficiency factor